jgi:hypothetical protein
VEKLKSSVVSPGTCIRDRYVASLQE